MKNSILDAILLASKTNHNKTVLLTLLAGDYKRIRLFGYNSIQISLTQGRTKIDIPEDALKVNPKEGTVEFALPPEFKNTKFDETIVHFLASNKYDGRFLVGSCVLI